VTTPRDAYRAALLELMQHDARVWCLDSDVGGLRGTLGAQFPDRYVDFGIAEQAMVSAAAGLARSGKLPFVNTMASFATTRAAEQVKVDVVIRGLPVRMVGTHAGLSAGHLGPTHHALEDVAVMRALPGMTVLVPADAAQVGWATRAANTRPGPVYLRLGRVATPSLHDPAAEGRGTFEIGRAVRLRDGADVTLAACGPLPLAACLDAADLLRTEGVAARVLDLHTVKPLDVDAVVDAARQTAGIVTVEDHNVLGGLGAAVAEVVAEHAPTMVLRIGVPDVYCPTVGGHAELLAGLGVDAGTVAAAARRIARRDP
jgi:transketolase